VAEAEFTVFPFVTEHLLPHVTAALDEAVASGLAVEVGPLGTRVRGDLDDVLALLDRVQRAAFAHGATKVITRVETDEPSPRQAR
jgi:uncharacterized protein YqgV (UPF0045/DUF77 family)